MRTHGLARACLCADEQSLSPHDRDARGQSRGGDALVPDHLDGPLQSASPVERASFSRALQRSGGGCGGAPVFCGAERLHSPQSDPGADDRSGGAAVRFRVEQLPMVCGEEGPSAMVRAADGARRKGERGQSVHMCKRELTAVGGDAEVWACPDRYESSMEEPSIM